MIIKQVEQKEKRKGASRCTSCDGRDEQERPGPGEKGRGDQPNGWWMGHTPDVSPPARKRVLSPFQGDTNQEEGLPAQSLFSLVLCQMLG